MKIVPKSYSQVVNNWRAASGLICVWLAFVCGCDQSSVSAPPKKQENKETIVGKWSDLSTNVGSFRFMADGRMIAVDGSHVHVAAYSLEEPEDLVLLQPEPVHKELPTETIGTNEVVWKHRQDYPNDTRGYAELTLFYGDRYPVCNVHPAFSNDYAIISALRDEAMHPSPPIGYKTNVVHMKVIFTTVDEMVFEQSDGTQAVLLHRVKE